MKNIIRQSDFIKKYKSNYNFILEAGHDYSNKTKFSQSLLGRVINRGYSLARMKAHNRTLNVLMNKIDEVYMNAVIKSLEQMGATKDDVFVSDDFIDQTIATLDKILLGCVNPIQYVSDINNAPKKLNVLLQDQSIKEFDVKWNIQQKNESVPATIANVSGDVSKQTTDGLDTHQKQQLSTTDGTQINIPQDEEKKEYKSDEYNGEIIIPEGYSKVPGFEEPKLIVTKKKSIESTSEQPTEQPKIDQPTPEQSIELITNKEFDFNKALKFINQLYNYAKSNEKTLTKDQINFILKNLNDITIPTGNQDLEEKIYNLQKYLQNLINQKSNENKKFIYESTLDKPKIKKDKKKDKKIKKSFDKKLSSYYKTETDIGNMKVSNFNPHNYLNKLKKQGKLNEFINLVKQNVNREQLKEIQLSAEILYGRDEERTKAEFPRNFVTQEPERIKLENKWKRNITQVKSKYLPFYSLTGEFPSDLDPIILSSKEQKLRKGDSSGKLTQPTYTKVDPNVNNLSEGQLKLMGLKSDSSGDAVFLRVTIKDTLQQGKINEFGLITKRLSDGKFLIQAMFHFSDEINLKINKGEDVINDINKNVFDFNNEPPSGHDIYPLYKLFIKPTNSDKTEKIVIYEQKRFIFVTYENNEYYLWLKEKGQKINVKAFKFENGTANVKQDFTEQRKPRTWQFTITQKNGIEDKNKKEWKYDNITSDAQTNILEDIKTFCKREITK